jgi:hypothetical protein
MDHEIERMLENWARWKVSGGWGGANTVSSLYNLGPRSPRSGNVIPILNGEAEDLDRIIEGLADVRLKRVIVIQYQWGGAQEGKARRCGCCVNTFKARLEKAKQMILSEKYRRSDVVRKITACNLIANRV